MKKNFYKAIGLKELGYANSNSNAHKKRFAKRMLFCMSFIALVTIGFTAIAMSNNTAKQNIITAASLAVVPLVLTKGATESDEQFAERQLLQRVKELMGGELENFKTTNPAYDVAKLTAIENSLKDLTSKTELAALKTQLEEIGLTVQGLKEKPKQEAHKSIGNAFIDAYKTMLEAGKIKVNGKMVLGKGGSETMEVKVAGTMTLANVLPEVGGAVPFTLGDIQPGLTRIQRRSPFILQLVSIANTVKSFVQWVEQKNPDDGLAATTSEGSSKHQTDFDLQEASMKVEKITAFIKVSTEMLDDVDFIQGEINQELVELIRLKADEQVLNGDGSTPDLKGIMEYAQPFAAGSFAATILEANNFDVLRVAINQIIVAFFNPSYIVMHPSDVAAMDLTKDSQGRYVMPPFTTNGGMTIKGLPVIENTGIAEGDYLVGDFSKSNVRMRKDASLTVGFENDDFTKNLVTIMGEMRLVHYIKSNHVNAFVTGTFATDRAALEIV